MTVVLRARGTGQAWLAELYRGETWLYTFQDTYAGPDAAIDAATKELHTDLANQLAILLGDTLDVRAVSLVQIEEHAATESATRTRNDAVNVSNAIRKALSHDARRFSAIREASGLDLFEVCAVLDKQAALKKSRAIEDEARSAMRELCWHWRKVLPKEPGSGKRDISAIAQILIAKKVKAVCDRANDEGLMQYVRKLKASSGRPRLTTDKPSPREKFIAEGVKDLIPGKKTR